MSFQQGLSGLDTASTNLDVIGNNVANASTVGFKDSVTQFSDVYASSIAGSSNTTAGIGATVSNIEQEFGQGNITTTNNPLDLAVNGNGFFQIQRGSATAFTRDGQFQVDANGFVSNSAGDHLQGYPVNGAGQVQVGATPQDLQVNTSNFAPNATTKADVQANFNSSAASLNPASFNYTDSTTYTSTTTVQVFDSLGNSHNLALYFVKSNAAANTWDVRAQLDGAAVNAGASVGTLTFNSSGAISSPPTVLPFSLSLAMGSGATTPQTVKLDLTGSTQFGTPFAVNNVTQDGYAAGSLIGYAISSSGMLSGNYSNGQTRNMGQIVLASFNDPQGLQNIGGNAWSESFTSGQSLIGTPGQGTLGTLQSGALEQSNVDLTTELVNMITAQRDYQANAQTIKTEDQLLQTLVNL
jgi:flagellar hook protein FlgE